MLYHPSDLQQLIKTFTSPSSKFFMPVHEFISEIASLAPYVINQNKEQTTPKLSPSEFRQRAIQNHISLQPSVKGANLTSRYSSPDIPDDSIAYYRVRGTIIAESYYRISSKTLQQDFLQADQNSKISAHFIHISSGGGQAWYLEQLAATIKSLNKPVHAFVERVAGSAAYYIASQADYISSATPYDIIGSIGTMVSFTDVQPMFEKWGMKFIEEYATQSELKNKKYSDLRDGKPEQFITDELDPLAEQFINDVRSGRPVLSKLDLTNEVFQGETYYANKALEIGLIDKVQSYQQALTYLLQSIKSIKTTAPNSTKLLNYLNN